ncbi:MAG TPA: hypothetical protein VI172_13385 [Candidatus Dormibacteraeota bacterium]|jgi:hypothetical protein
MRHRVETYGAPVVAGLLALLFLIGLIAPAIKSPAPHDITIGVVNAPSQMVSGLTASGAFDVTSYDSEDAARSAIDSRDIDGALVIGSSGPKLIVAGAAGDGVTGVITGVFTQMFAQQGQQLPVETVHPFSSGDPHGLILFFVILAILIGTLISQALVGLRKGIGLPTKVSIVALFAIVAGPAAMGMATWIAGDYGSGIWMAMALLALGSAAVGAVVAGAAAVLGRPGIALSALIVVLLDLVCSGGPIGSQLLPDAYRWLAPGMPAGQLYSAVRGALFFDNAGIATPFGVLSLWLLGGLILMVVGQLVSRRSPAREGTVSGEGAVLGADR